MHEEVSRGSAAELASHYAEQPVRGELVLLVGAAPRQRAALGEALGGAGASSCGRRPGRARPLRLVAKLTGLRRQRALP